MTDQHRSAITAYIITVCEIAMVWYASSFLIGLMLAGAEDNPDMTAAVPPSLSISWSVVSFPMFCIGNWDHAPAGMADRDFALLGLFAMFVNSVLWALLLGFLFLLCCRLSSNRSELGQHAGIR
jgi:hypothetical protein